MCGSFRNDILAAAKVTVTQTQYTLKYTHKCGQTMHATMRTPTHTHTHARRVSPAITQNLLKGGCDTEIQT